MLEGYYTDPVDWRVVVLDFDLSWHRGAYEHSVLHTTAAGYLAPEQIRPIKGVSTRNAAVDSFGFGMTLLYLCSGQEPLPDQHRHEGWEGTVRDACRLVRGSHWASTPERVARLIISATRDRQAARWDMTEIGGELERLRQATISPNEVSSAELLVEEIAVHSRVLSDYEWDPDALCARRSLPTGTVVELATEIKYQQVVLRIAWTSTGVEERRGLGKYISVAARATKDQLQAAGWQGVKSKVESHTVFIEARLNAGTAQGQVGEVAAALDIATEGLRNIGA